MSRDAATLAAKLELFTTDELLAEVARRAHALHAIAHGETLCSGCVHEVFWRGRGEPPASFNTCSLKHALEFRMPMDDDPRGDDAGFYRPGGCIDRAEPPPPAPPPPPPRGQRPRSAT